MIHSTAIVHPNARLGSDIEIGPYAVIDAGVELGDHCRVGPHVHITGQSRIGPHNIFHAGAVIGDAPQDLKYKGEPTGLIIGGHNIFREHTTVHRSTKVEDLTRVGSHNYIMANAHLGHNVQLGDHVVICNGALLAGHVVVEDRAFLSGNCLVHQFTRIGAFALMQGGSGIGQDLPPFCVSTGVNGLCGLNVVGLRRGGFSGEERIELRRAYHLLFRSSRNLRAALEEAEKRFQSAPVRKLLEFIKASKRGVCRDVAASGNGDSNGPETGELVS